MQSTVNRALLLFLLCIAAGLLGVGLFAPIITFKKFFFIQNTFSILTACWSLLKQGQLFLFFIISIFSVILPIIKLSVLAILVIKNQYELKQSAHKLLDWIHRLGRWSMLDVFVVAILVVVVKLGAIGNVEKHIGLYAYAAAAILTMLLTNHIVGKFNQKNIKPTS